MKTLLFVAFIATSLFSTSQIRVRIPDNSRQQSSSSAGDCNFQIGEKVEVFDPIEKNWFTSSILKIEETKWFIHYDGYDSKWDTWATCDRIRRIGESKATPTSSAATTSSSSAAASSANSTTIEIAMPQLVPNAKFSIQVGDPIIIVEENKNNEIKLLVTNIWYDKNTFSHKYYADRNGSNEYYTWEDFKLDPTYNYTALPEKPTISTNDNYKIGDLIETYWAFNTQFQEYSVVPGIIIGKDGDNFVIYFEEENGKSTQCEWRYISDFRSIGSTKNIHNVSQYGAKGADFDNCKNAIAANCGGSSKGAGSGAGAWDFLWYYRHDMKNYQFNGLSSHSMGFTQASVLKEILAKYECLSKTFSTFSDVGNAGRVISDRLDVQKEFLKDYKGTIKGAFDQKIKAKLDNFVADTKNGHKFMEYMRTDGLSLLKQQMRAECKGFEESYALLGGTIVYPDKDLEEAYNYAVDYYLKNNLEESDGLKCDGVAYSAKDARVEQLCIADLKKNYDSGAQVSSIGCKTSDFVVELNSLGTPVYRTKAVLIIFKSPSYRTTVEKAYGIREEYLGNGSYGNPSYYREGIINFLR